MTFRHQTRSPSSWILQRCFVSPQAGHGLEDVERQDAPILYASSGEKVAHSVHGQLGSVGMDRRF